MPHACYEKKDAEFNKSWNLRWYKVKMSISEVQPKLQKVLVIRILEELVQFSTRCYLLWETTDSTGSSSRLLTSRSFFIPSLQLLAQIFGGRPWGGVSSSDICETFPERSNFSAFLVTVSISYWGGTEKERSLYCFRQVDVRCWSWINLCEFMAPNFSNITAAPW